MWPFAHKFKVPGPGFKETIQIRLANTPDYWKLEQKDRHLMFWYFDPHGSKLPIGESFMSGFTKHGFVLWKRKDVSSPYPIPLLHKVTGTPSARVCGGLHFVSPRDVISLDKAMQNGVEFHRTRISIVVPYEKTQTNVLPIDGRMIGDTIISNIRHHILQAYMYIGLKSVWEERLDGGYNYSPVRRYNRPMLGDYYKWSAEE